MKTINRAQLRGKPLDDICRGARTERHLFGQQDNRVFCYGIYDNFIHMFMHPQCKSCKALVDNAEPVEGEP